MALGKGYNKREKCYYLQKCMQRGGSDVIGKHRPSYYAGVRFQRGRGLGSFFSKIFRWIKPLALPALKTVGKELGRASINTMGDVLAGQQLKTAGQEHFKKAGSNLWQEALTKMTGGRGRSLPLGLMPGAMENMSKLQFRGIGTTSTKGKRKRQVDSKQVKKYKKRKLVKSLTTTQDIFGKIRHN